MLHQYAYINVTMASLPNECQVGFFFKTSFLRYDSDRAVSALQRLSNYEATAKIKKNCDTFKPLGVKNEKLKKTVLLHQIRTI